MSRLIFSQDGQFTTPYAQFGRVSGLFISPDDMLYAIDSETNTMNHPGWTTGIRIGSMNADKVTAFIPPYPVDDRLFGAAGEGIAVDRDGNVYAPEGPVSRPVAGGGLTKYSSR